MNSDKESFDLFYQDLPEEISVERKTFSKILSMLCLSSVLSYIITLLIQIFLINTFPDYSENSWILMSINGLYSCFLALLFYVLTLKTSGLKPVPICIIKPGVFMQFLCMSIAIMFVGSIMGNSASSMIERIFGIEVNNNVSEVVESIGIWEIVVFVVILAPIVEELIFRKLLIDRISRYGTKFASIISGVLFGLFHGNLFQFFYAAGIGTVMGYMYCISGKIIYPIALHIIINFIGSVVALNVAEWSETSNELLQTVASCYSIIYIMVVCVGIILLTKHVKKSRQYMIDGILIKPFELLRYNFGFILFLIYSVASFMLDILN